MIILSLTFINNISEYGEIDPDKVKAAVNTFMRSCAGYSVATYALVSLVTKITAMYDLLQSYVRDNTINNLGYW